MGRAWLCGRVTSVALLLVTNARPLPYSVGAKGLVNCSGLPMRAARWIAPSLAGPGCGWTVRRGTVGAERLSPLAIPDAVSAAVAARMINVFICMVSSLQ